MEYNDYDCRLIPLLPMDGLEFVAAVTIKEDKTLLETQFFVILKDANPNHPCVEYPEAPVKTVEELCAADKRGAFDEAKKMLAEQQQAGSDL